MSINEYRTITRGPRKGMVVRKRRSEIRQERLALERAKREERDRKLNEQMSSEERPASTESWGGFLEVIGAYVGLCVLWGIVFLIASGLIALHMGWLFILLLIADICGDRFYKAPRRPHKYCPLLWVLR